ncbi:hypothetical protein QW573_02805 [Vibrio gallaecicus]|nr:hypothetical protein [Vibrio gallaecicus]MDN3613340.1 hypothetical protein [Vibrio gallaecicus]
MGNITEFIAGFIQLTSTIEFNSLILGSRQSFSPAKACALARVSACCQVWPDTLPMQLPAFHVCPILQRIHVNPVCLSVAVPSPLTVKRLSGVDLSMASLHVAITFKGNNQHNRVNGILFI